MASGKEGEFLAGEWAYVVHTPGKKRRLAQKHTKMSHCQVSEQPVDTLQVNAILTN